ncbi:Exosome complex component RRP43 [Smittium culicis]|uniref:Ribosomal RNA-processing protein 43 n=2 Tax=Smittium culicis TaxID=133412 RepID=A0A1R1XMC3_9FUNG|nr:Exosome complex component RRP43 [Smittium culicis]OMJ15777.1 Exosome complex component RRP43 [Smittium culicis]
MVGILNTGGIGTTDGSSTIRIGDTTVVCGIRAEVCEPKLSTPNKGFLVPNVKLSSMCSSKYSAGQPGNYSQVLSQHISDLFNEQVFGLDQLCIEPGKAVWVLYADIVCLNFDGCVLDAAIIALTRALLATQLKAPSYNPDVGSITVDSLSGATSSLAVSQKLYPSTFCLVQAGEYLLADPTSDEEELADGYVTVVYNDKNQIVNIYKLGSTVLPQPTMNTIFELSEARNLETQKIYS